MNRIVGRTLLGSLAAGAALGAPAASLTAAADPVTLTVLVRSDAQENQWEKDVFDMYQKQHPEVKINEIIYTGSVMDKLAPLFAADQGPDVWDHGGYVASYHYNGWLLNQKPLIDRDMAELDRSDIFPGAWNSYVGPQFAAGLPFIALPSPMWVNVDLLDKAGLAIPPVDWSDSSWSFDKFHSYAQKLTRLDANGKVVQWGAGFAANGELERFTYPVIGGGSFFDQPQTWESGVPQSVHFSDPANVAVYDKYVGMVKEGIATTDYWGNWFNGKIAMVGAAGGWLGYGQFANMKFRWSMAPMPYSPNTGDVIYTDPWMISSQTKHVKESWDLVKFLTSKQAMEPYMKVAHFPPVRRSVLAPFIENAAKASGYLTAAQVMLSIEGGINHGLESPDHRLAGEPDYQKAISPIFEKMWRGQLSPKEALAQADQVVAPIAEKYRNGLEAGHQGTSR